MGDFDISARLAEAKSRKLDDRTLAQRAADLAQELLAHGLKALRSDERALLSALSRLAAEPRNRQFIAELCGQVLHAPDPAAQAEKLRKLLDDFNGVPNLFSTMARLRLRAAAMAAGSLQNAAMAEVRRIFRSTFGELTLPTQVEKLNRRVRDFAKEGISLALRPLAPDVYGAKSAERYQKNLEAILSKQEGVGLSIDPWRLVPGLSPYRPNHGARALAEKLKPLIALSLKGDEPRPIIVESGTSDIVAVVAEGVKLALAGSAFRQADVALELPGYLRGSLALLRDLAEWAQPRAAKGAKPLRVLLDKGSHLEAERLLAHRYGEASAAVATKSETDTLYKKLVHAAIDAKPKAIRPVIATHNLFDLAYALLDWGRSKREGLPDFVFTTGLGNHLGRMLARAGAKVGLVASVASESGESEFETYLLGLIHEVSMPDSVLSAGYAVESASMAWGRMRQHFLASLSGREEASGRSGETRPPDAENFTGTPLLSALNRAETEALYAASTETGQEEAAPTIPLEIDGKEVETPLTGIHRSLTAAGVEEYRYVCADYGTVHQVLGLAARASTAEPPSLEERRRQLLKFARLLGKRRTTLCSLLVRDAGFTVEDADAEVRDAADACRYYEQCIMQDGYLDGTQPAPLGVVAVTGDLAHPLAGAVSSIAAAWITGNCVIHKPAMPAVRLGLELESIASEAGLARPRFQSLTCLDNQIADRLMSDASVGGIVLSGRAAMATRLATKAPSHALFASDAGVASVYLAPGCDWTQAVRDVVRAAFRRSGQGADCPHVLLVDAGIYDRQGFMNALKDAVSSLRAQPGWTEAADLGPLARPLTNAERGLMAKLDGQAAWLVTPAAQGLGSQLWTPGVATGVKPGSPLLTPAVRRLPLLALVRTTSLAESIALQRRVSSNAAAAVYSLDKELVEQWVPGLATSIGGHSSAQTRSRKLFVNCCPESRPGLLPAASLLLPGREPAPQPGDPNFLTVLSRWQEVARPQRRGKLRNIAFTPWESLTPKPSPDDAMRLTSAADSLSYWWENEFGVEHAVSPCEGVRVTRRYHANPLCLRAEKAMSDIDLSIALMAALKAGCELQVSTATLRPWMPRALEPLGITVTVESRDEFESRFEELAARAICVRDTAATDATRERAALAGLHLSSADVLANGRHEMLHCMFSYSVTRRERVGAEGA